MAESDGLETRNIFDDWPALQIDGNITLCPSLSVAKHLALIYNVNQWPALTREVKDTGVRYKALYGTEKKARYHLETKVRTKRGVAVFYMDTRRMCNPRPYVIAV